MLTDDMEINATSALNNMCTFYGTPLISAGTDIYGSAKMQTTVASKIAPFKWIYIVFGIS